MEDPFDEIVKELANPKSAVSVTAAAGCGKTEAIVRAVAQSGGKQLILTHTNAGVAALRARLRKHCVESSKYTVETIASWLLKYSIAYPSMSGLADPRPISDGWENVYPAAIQLFDYPFIRGILQASYTGVFVDEYQDCTQKQHEVILKICKWLPVRVLGDPLQGIFQFGNNVLVNWIDVQSEFKPLPDLLVPYRWKKTNGNSNILLGEQLAEIRKKLEDSEEIDLRDYSEIKWLEWSEQQEESICEHMMKESGSIVGIHQWPQDAHRSASKTRGIYQSIEEMDCRDLMNAACKIDRAYKQGNYQNIKNEIDSLIKQSCAVSTPLRFLDDINLISELEHGNLSVIPEIARLIRCDSRTQVYRRELLIELERAGQEFTTGKYATFEEAAYSARYKTRLNGRSPEHRIISRTLLVKGLEFDHAIVLNANKLRNRENFYVAITRGSQSLSILSSSPIVKWTSNN